MTHHPLALALAALALAACSPDAGRNPLAPSAPKLAVGGRGDDATKAKQVHGTFEAQEAARFDPPTGPPVFLIVRLEATGTASHLGRYTAVANFTVTVAARPEDATAVGTVTLTAANGDVIRATDVGVAASTGTVGVVDITETWTITGGTGRFAGATGTLTVTRRLNQLSGASSGSLEGTINLPK
jgi:hypothetical protein